MPFLLLSLTTLFPQSGSGASVPATEDPLPKPVGSWSPSGLWPVPSQGEEQLHPDSCAHLAYSLR